MIPQTAVLIYFCHERIQAKDIISMEIFHIQLRVQYVSQCILVLQYAANVPGFRAVLSKENIRQISKSFDGDPDPVNNPPVHKGVISAPILQVGTGQVLHLQPMGHHPEDTANMVPALPSRIRLGDRFVPPCFLDHKGTHVTEKGRGCLRQGEISFSFFFIR